MEILQKDGCDFDKSAMCQQKWLIAKRLIELEENAGVTLIKEGKFRCRGPIPDPNSPDGLRCRSRFVLPQFEQEAHNQEVRQIVPMPGNSESNGA